MNRLLLLLLLLSAQRSIAQPISWLTDCAEKNFCLNQGSCTMGYVQFTEKAITNCGNPNVNYSYKVDIDNNGTQDIQSSEDTVKGNFTKGTHKVTWRASDGCGMVIQCTYLFHIKDCNPPNLVCINGLTQTLDAPLCEASFNVNQFILNLTDNCIPAAQVERGMRIAGTGTGFPSTTDLTFGICDNGLNLLEVWVRDNNGLTNQCSNYVLIQSSDPVCDCNADAELGFSGCARAANNVKLSNYRAIATVKSTAGLQPAFSKVKTTTVSDSCFSLEVVNVPFDADYQVVVRADKPDAPLNGVTTFDLVLISKHILGIESFTSAYQMEAADVNNSNSVTTFDIVEARKLLLGINDSFTYVPSWRFVRPLADPSILSGFTALKDTYQLNLPNLQVDTAFQGFNFVGVKYADVNYSAALAGQADDRAITEPLYLKVDDRWLKAGEEAELYFRLGDTYQLDGWQVALETDPDAMQFQSLNGLPLADYVLTDHSLRAITYDCSGSITRRFDKDEVIFVLKVKALQTVRLSDVLRLNETTLRPEAYVPGVNKRSMHQPIAFRFDFKDMSVVKSVELSPNPFSTEANFDIQLRSAAPAQLEIFNLDGRRVYAEQFDLEAGRQTIRVTDISLPAEKIFIYQLLIGGERFSGKMVRM